MFFSERWADHLTETKLVKTIYCFEHSVAMRAKPIDTEAGIFLLSPCIVEALNFTIKSCSLKIRHDHVFKATGLVLSRFESTGFLMDILTRINIGGRRLTHQVGVELAGINRTNRFAYVCSLSDTSFINNCFACKNDRWTTNDVFSNFLQYVFISFCEGIKFCIGRFV